MLNYIWAALIISAFAFAVVYDVGDIRDDTYRNGQALPVELAYPEGYDPEARRVPVEIRVDSARYADFYGVEGVPGGTYPGYLRQTREGVVLRFEAGASLPEPLATIQGVSQSRDEELQGTLVDFAPPGGPAGGTGGAGGEADAGAGPGGAAAGAPPDEAGPEQAPAGAGLEEGDQIAAAPAQVRFERVRFVKLNAIAAAALDFAEVAAELALGLIGVLALFLGILKIAEEAGVIYALVKLVRPVLRPLFPELPEDHPALGMIALNLTANIFGLGNAATPFGIKAMEELQTLNPTEDTATNSMVMLLAMNTASVQLVPPVLLLALMGLQINQLIFAIIITTGLSLLIAIVAAKLYGMLPGSKASDPMRDVRSDGPPGPPPPGGPPPREAV